MTETRRVLLWRHGQTKWNAERRFQGHADIPLDETGTAQAAHAARTLARLKPDAIITSDLSRATGTAQALEKETGLTATSHPGLRERSAGQWEGLNRDDIIARWPEEYVRFDVPGGEDMHHVGQRVTQAIHEGLTATPPNGLLVAVSHGGAIRAGITHLLGLPPQHREALGPLDNCSWSLLGPSATSHWRLLEHNAANLPEQPPLTDDH